MRNFSDNGDGGAGATAHGWFKAMRSNDALVLLRRNRCAFILLYVLAFRARWHAGFDEHDLEIGQAFLGDHESHGLTEQEYRTAKEQLEKWGFATFKGTNKGTIATLTSTSIFNIGAVSDNDQNNEQVTNSQRTNNEQVTTNKEGKERKEGKDKGAAPPLLGFPPEVQHWNSQPPLPKVKTMTAGRLSRLAARRQDPFFAAHFNEAVERVCQSDFCLGHNDRGWKADFDWMLKPNTVAKVMEGNYDNNNSRPAPSFRELIERHKVLEELISKHPCNPDSIKHTGDETPEQHSEYREFKSQLEQVKKLIANGGAK